MISNKFLIGGDPEFPCINTKTNKYVSLVPYVKGTKQEKYPIPVNLCFQQIDNVGIEFCTPPCTEYEYYAVLVDNCINHTNTWLKTINPAFELQVVSSASYDDNELNSEEAQSFGCEPSYSIYRNGESYRPSAEEVGPLRSFSYHIHYGFDKGLTKTEFKNFIVLNDLFLGIPSIEIDLDEDRRKIYGNLSDHRYKSPTRFEYRTLGAGVHNNTNFISRGIQMIRDNVNNAKTLVKRYYNDLSILDATNIDKELFNDIKLKLIKDGIYNQ